jgi:hypothetical protein
MDTEISFGHIRFTRYVLEHFRSLHYHLLVNHGHAPPFIFNFSLGEETRWDTLADTYNMALPFGQDAYTSTQPDIKPPSHQMLLRTCS